jgi:LPS-assembly lipoprotein
MSSRAESGWLIRCLTLGVLLTLAGCGWHLRGSMPGMPSLSGVAVAVESVQGESDLYRELTQQIGRTGAVVVAPRAGVPVLRLLDEQVERRRVTGSRGSAEQEFDLEYLVSWELIGADGERVAGPGVIEQVRSLIIERDDLLGSEGREELLLEDLRRDTVFQLVERLRLLTGGD